MLSERERRELEIIERALEASEPRLSAMLASRLERRMRRQIVYSRLLIALGVLVTAAGLVLGLDQALVQGLALACAGACWWIWIDGPSSNAPSAGRGSGRPNGPSASSE